MRSLARRYSAHPAVVETAGRICRGIGPRDHDGRLYRLGDWLRGVLRFHPDPQHVEAITTPDVHLRRIAVEGESWGDCDDAATLGGSLALAMGQPAAFVLASYRPSRVFHHVYAQGRGALDGWIDLDPFRSERAGALAPTRALRVPI